MYPEHNFEGNIPFERFQVYLQLESYYLYFPGNQTNFAVLFYFIRLRKSATNLSFFRNLLLKSSLFKKSVDGLIYCI